MEKKLKSGIAKTKPINIMLQEELITRVNAVCADQSMTIQEFVTDAIVEKLELVYKERRTKDRL
jgi:predicted DNA binding CopG/RHH family protein